MARRTVTVTETIHVDRSPEHVFDFTQDYDRRTTWDAGIAEASYVSRDPVRARVKVPGMGSATVEYRLYRRGDRTSAVFTDVDSWIVVGGGGSWRYEPSGQGTDWTETNTLELRHPRLTGWLAPLIERIVRSSTKTAMRKAKAMMEAGA